MFTMSIHVTEPLGIARGYHHGRTSGTQKTGYTRALPNTYNTHLNVALYETHSSHAQARTTLRAGTALDSYPNQPSD